MPAWWCCVTPPTAMCLRWAAGPVRCRARCAAPLRAGIATSASSPAAARATATPITSCIGQMAERRSSPTWCWPCRFHHRAVHEEGFQVVVDNAGQFQFLRPDGEPLPAVPPAAHWQGPGEPLAPTVARLARPDAHSPEQATACLRFLLWRPCRGWRTAYEVIGSSAPATASSTSGPDWGMDRPGDEGAAAELEHGRRRGLRS